MTYITCSNICHIIFLAGYVDILDILIFLNDSGNIVIQVTGGNERILTEHGQNAAYHMLNHDNYVVKIFNGWEI